MAKLPSWTNGAPVFKTQHLLIIISMAISIIIRSAPGIVPVTMGTEQNMNEWSLEFPLSRLSWPRQPSRTDGVHFLECGEGVWVAGRATRGSRIPLTVFLAVVSKSVLAALIKKVL